MTLPLRIFLLVASLFLGVSFPLAFLLSAFLAFGFFTRDEVEAPSRHSVRDFHQLVSLEDMRNACESPAELAFLDTMVSKFQLREGRDGLQGEQITLKSQVKIGRYRLDFLIDDRVVVEVDGATWHSSSEAVVRDTQRDKFLSGQGFVILRIPAKTVFNAPDKVIKSVVDARARLDQNIRARASIPSEKQNDHVIDLEPLGVRNLLPRINSALEEINIKAKEMRDRSIVEKEIRRVLRKVELVVENAADYVEEAERLNLAQGNKPTERVKSFLDASILVADSISNDQSAEDLRLDPQLSAILSGEGGRQMFHDVASNAIADHLNIIEISYGRIFSDQRLGNIYSIGEGRTNLSLKLMEELSRVFLTTRTPSDFAHPFIPDVFDVVQKLRWRGHVRRFSNGLD